MFRGKTPLIVAGILGVMAALLAYQTIKSKEDRLASKWKLTPVVVAGQDIEEGSALGYDMLAKMDVPIEFAGPSLVKPEQIEKIIDQNVMVPLQRGDPIMWSHFFAPGTVERLSDIVNNHGRAISLDIAGSQAISGWLRPSDHVDILGTFQDTKDNQMVTVTMLQNVVVLATGTISGNTPVEPKDKVGREYSSVTLMVLPEEAEILTLAAELGSLRLTLRNTHDMGRMDQRGKATQHTLLTGERMKEIQKLRDSLPDVVYPPSHGGGK
jgi:pilus assembly protein CpaB